MSLRTRNRPSTDFSLASMSDLVFLLLIFFMLTSSFVNQAGVKIELPTSESDKPSSGQNTVTISLEGYYYWNDRLVAREDVPAMIERALTDPSAKNNKTITVKTDRFVTMDEVAYVLGFVAKHGGSAVIATKRQ
jgi:biopolymer transport protein ExbD